MTVFRIKKFLFFLFPGNMEKRILLVYIYIKIIFIKNYFTKYSLNIQYIVDLNKNN